ncbi:MAG: hypothetical protein NZO16_03740 [Deltaproteobacteria bacterium]|nr:hypothetical protein [Deltaproteobacteria bacterium]
MTQQPQMQNVEYITAKNQVCDLLLKYMRDNEQAVVFLNRIKSENKTLSHPDRSTLSGIYETVVGGRISEGDKTALQHAWQKFNLESQKLQQNQARASDFLGLQHANSNLGSQVSHSYREITREYYEKFFKGNEETERIFRAILARQDTAGFAVRQNQFTGKYRESLIAKGAIKSTAQLELLKATVDIAAKMDGGPTAENIKKAYDEIKKRGQQFFNTKGEFWLTEDKFSEWEKFKKEQLGLTGQYSTAEQALTYLKELHDSVKSAAKPQGRSNTAPVTGQMRPVVTESIAPIGQETQHEKAQAQQVGSQATFNQDLVSLASILQMHKPENANAAGLGLKQINFTADESQVIEKAVRGENLSDLDRIILTEAVIKFKEAYCQDQGPHTNEVVAMIQEVDRVSNNMGLTPDILRAKKDEAMKSIAAIMNTDIIIQYLPHEQVDVVQRVAKGEPISTAEQKQFDAAVINTASIFNLRYSSDPLQYGLTVSGFLASVLLYNRELLNSSELGALQARLNNTVV